eukprot:gene13660-biopygen3530
MGRCSDGRRTLLPRSEHCSSGLLVHSIYAHTHTCTASVAIAIGPAWAKRPRVRPRLGPAVVAAPVRPGLTFHAEKSAPRHGWYAGQSGCPARSVSFPLPPQSCIALSPSAQSCADPRLGQTQPVPQRLSPSPQPDTAPRRCQTQPLYRSQTQPLVSVMLGTSPQSPNTQPMETSYLFVGRRNAGLLPHFPGRRLAYLGDKRRHACARLRVARGKTNDNARVHVCLAFRPAGRSKSGVTRSLPANVSASGQLPAGVRMRIAHSILLVYGAERASDGDARRAARPPPPVFGRNGTRAGRGPDAGRTIGFKEMYAGRTQTGRGRCRFSLWPGSTPKDPFKSYMFRSHYYSE